MATHLIKQRLVSHRISLWLLKIASMSHSRWLAKLWLCEPGLNWVGMCCRLHWLSKSRGLDAGMEEAARAMLAKLPIKDHTHKFKRHHKCFVGKDAVQFLIQQVRNPLPTPPKSHRERAQQHHSQTG